MDRDYDKLLLENELYRKIIESIPDFLAYKNKKGIYEVVSETVNELYKKRFESIVGISMDDIYSKKALKDVRTLDNEVYRKKVSVNQIIDIETDQGIKQMDSKRTPIFDENGAISGILSLSRDVSDVVRIKDELEEMSLIQNSIIQVSKSFVESSLYDFDDVMNESLKKLAKAINADRAYIFTYNFKGNTMDNIYEWCGRGVSSEIKNQKSIPITNYLDGWVDLHRKNKNVYVDNVESLDKRSNLYKIHNPRKAKTVLTMPIFVDNECYGYLGFDKTRSVMDWSQLEKQMNIVPEIYSSFISHRDLLTELEEAKEQAMQASNVQSDFIGKMTHEIRTPINGVSNALFLLADTELTEDQSEYLGVMKYSLEILSNMVSNLLDYSQIEVNKLKHKSSDISLENEVIKLIKVNKYMASNKGLGIYFNYDYRIPTVISTDVEKIRQILNNLIINAIKYTNYGHVEVNAYLLSLKPPYVDVKFEIVDTGIGISEENVKHIFESFYQVGDVLNKNPFGTGLGLTIVKDLIEFLKGELSVQSTERVGSNFSFVLTFYTPIEETRQPLDMSALLVKLTEGPHSDVESLLEAHFDEVSVCTERNIRSFMNGKYDFIFVYTNDLTNYERKLDLVMPYIEEVDEETRRILLYDTVKEDIIVDTQDMYDFTMEIPESSELLVAEITRIPSVSEALSAKATSESNIKPKILLVDDNNINRKVMGQLLEKLNVDVIEAANGYDALEMAKQHKLDMIFMDILMPGMDGYETTKRIRQLEGAMGSIPILAVTANDPATTEEKAIEVGMNGVLGKPLYKADIEKTLEQYFGKFNEPGKSKRKARKGKVEQEEGPGVFDQREFEQFYSEVQIRREILMAIMEDKDKDLRDIMEAFASSNSTQIHDKVHYMKGSFTYIRAKKLVVLSEMIMNLCKQQLIDEAMLLEDSYITNYLELIEEIENYMLTM